MEEIDRDYPIIESMREAYKSALNEARKYYLTCEGTGIIPEKGLQKVVYDLGKRVRPISEQNSNRKFLAGMEGFNINRFAASVKEVGRFVEMMDGSVDLDKYL